MTLVSWHIDGNLKILDSDSIDFIEKTRPEFIFFQGIPKEEDEKTSFLEKLNYKVIKNVPASRGAKNAGTITAIKTKELKYSFLKKIDTGNEGRIIEIVYGNIVLLNVVFAIGKVGTLLQQQKQDFFKRLIEHLETKKAEGKEVILVGDFQIAPTSQDVTNPTTNNAYSGFLPSETELFDVLKMDGYVDVYRELNPSVENKFTYWPDRMDARRKNKGWRFDVFWVSPGLKSKVIKADILTKVKGSTHCPITLDIDL
jgi:exodeoxyribonuclease-3